MNSSELKALVSLVDDPDENVYSHISGKIREMGSVLIPALEQELTSHANPVVQKRIDLLIQNIRFEQTCGNLEQWLTSESKDLLTAATLLCCYQYPDCDVSEQIINPVNKISRDIWLELNDNLTPLEKVKVLNHVLFNIHGFKCNNISNHSIRHLFLNDLLRTKHGNSLSLSLLYMIVAHHNNIPVMGVNLPNQFVVCYVNDPQYLIVPSGNQESEIAFYINPSNNGALFSRDDINLLFLHKREKPHPAFFKPTDNKSVFLRMLGHISYSFQKLNHPEKVKEINAMIDVAKKHAEVY